MCVMNSYHQFYAEPLRSQLMDKLWSVQWDKGYIPDEKVKELSEEFDVSMVEIEGVISFYHFFHRKPTGKYTIYVDNSIIAEHKGYQDMVRVFEKETGASLGKVDKSGMFGLFSTPCIGLSDQAPAALINFIPFTHLDQKKIKEIIAGLKNGESLESFQVYPKDNIMYKPSGDKTLFFRSFEPGVSINEVKKINREAIIELLKKSELSGRGGAFFPTWRKWQSAMIQPSYPKYVVCNADEGEPGTFKDRVVMNTVPETMIEGMIVCAYTVGASKGFIYLRGEYWWLRPKLEKTLSHYREKGLLGNNCAGIHGFDFDIRIQMGAGAYVCGEETALLESMEGKRGEPRTKWFFPVEKGYLQQPTIVNNVETFSAVAQILNLGLDKYLKLGIPGSPGTKLISVSGDCTNPGIYEIEWGMTLAELLELSGAQDPYFIQVSGPGGESVSMAEKFRRISMLDPMNTQDIRCGGSVMIFSKKRDIVKILINFAEFFKHESCGICTPCRAGNFIIQRKLARLEHGLAVSDDLTDLLSWSEIMRKTSRCGLGKTAPNALIFSLNKFGEYFNKKLDQNYDGHSLKFDLKSATSEHESYKK
jgi:[NiFe] hydrogenase diaphorase moiety large subunit